ncbi:GNAT family N-acetyltransferase [Embleya hyalina]|uniref:N-acetyltransferase domain-containing protein n=1 Tax=Embleya hyalina TaxID=516124 RepID=A0A401YR03_9ACTN|nr:GNAT family N-acetyltransferase [Embleya hyalina]GCD97022.1 hypothetical protein EHYA_04709 [Embleya hyalina]
MQDVEPGPAPAHFRFRRVLRADFPLLASWLSRPHVRRWWNHETEPEAVARDFGDAADGLEPSEDLLALRDGTPVGLVQRSRLADYPEYLAEFEEFIEVPAESVTIDYLVGDPGLVGRGVGTAMIRAVVADTWAARARTPAIVVAVAAGNIASWRVLERVGFTRVGEGAMEPDNPVDPPLHYLYRLDRPVDAQPSPTAAHDTTPRPRPDRHTGDGSISPERDTHDVYPAACPPPVGHV